MKTPKARRTCNAIVAAATELFMQHTIDKVPISAITDHAGLSKSTFYTYFDSKDDLVWHILEHEVTAFFALLDQVMTSGYSTQSIDQIIDPIIAFVLNNRDKLKMLHDVKFYDYLGEDNIRKRFFDQYGIIGPFYRWLERGMNAGEIQVRDIKFTAYFIKNVIHEMIDEILSDNMPYTITELSSNVKHLLKKYLEVNDES